MCFKDDVFRLLHILESKDLKNPEDISNGYEFEEITHLNIIHPILRKIHVLFFWDSFSFGHKLRCKNYVFKLLWILENALVKKIYCWFVGYSWAPLVIVVGHGTVEDLVGG